MMYIAIGCFNAKTKFSELLQGVKEGRRYTITLRGNPIADLVPTGSAASQQDVGAAIERMRQLHKVQGVSTTDLLSWVEEGRQ